MDIRELDQNFQFGNISRENLQWIDRYHPCVEINGAADIDEFFRISKEKAAPLTYAVQCISESTAGVRMRFRTNASYVALKAVIRWSDDMSHMPRSGSGGFDLYAGKAGEIPAFRKTFMPDNGRVEVSGEAWLPDGEWWDVVIHFPLYNGVRELAVGLPSDCQLQPPLPFALPAPVVFYGSSITQGGCASRPGNMYPTIVCRELGLDQYNLGFSGSAKGEPEVADYIAGLNMAALVLDYDYNADSVEHLKATHEPFFTRIRQVHPTLPIILMSKPNVDNEEELSAQRCAVVRRTYENALARGDKHVWFIDGADLFGSAFRDCCTVDGCHPNDFGFVRMAQTVLPVLCTALNLSRQEDAK